MDSNFCYCTYHHKALLRCNTHSEERFLWQRNLKWDICLLEVTVIQHVQCAFFYCLENKWIIFNTSIVWAILRHLKYDDDIFECITQYLSMAMEDRDPSSLYKLSELNNTYHHHRHQKLPQVKQEVTSDVTEVTGGRGRGHGLELDKN